MKSAVAALVVCALLAAAEAAFGHARTASQEPPAGSVLASLPSEVRIRFNEPLQSGESQLWVEDESGIRIAHGALVLLDGASSMTCELPRDTRPGRFHVFWRATSTDGHHTVGDYWFTVSPAAPTDAD